MPQKRSTRPPKPVNPVDAFRGPLAYITGRPEFKGAVKKQSIKQLMLEAATIPAPPPPPDPVIIDEKPEPAVKPARPSRSSRARSRVPSEVASIKSSKHKEPSEIYEEADEEIVRPDLLPEDSQSRRSASPAASRHSRAAPSTRSRRHVSSSSTVIDDDDHADHRHNRSRRHASSSHSVYSEDREDDYRPRHRSHRSERSRREPSYREHSRERERYYPHPFSQPHHYPYSYASVPPPVQPIVIYSSPAPAIGCGGHHHSCHSSHHERRCYSPQPRPVLGLAAPVSDLITARTPAPAPVQAAFLEPLSAPSEISSVSNGSTKSRAMSYKWYTATQPLLM